jgi:hypothetical protein
MTVTDTSPPVPATEPTDPLAVALADPEVRQALAVIAANAPDLAVLVLASKALLGRSRDILDNVNERVEYLREVIDPDEVTQYLELRQSLREALPTIEGFLQSPILRPEIVEIVGRAGEAALEAEARTSQVPARPVGSVFALLKQLKDPQLQETITYALEFAKAFGRQRMRGR